MSDAIQHINVDDDEFIDTPKALRDHVKKIQAALTARDQQIGTLTGQVTAGALKDVLSGFKNPERVKTALLGDKVDPLDSAAVTKWLEESGDDYAKATAAPPQPDPSQSPPAGVTPEEIQAQKQLALSGEFVKPGDMSKVQALEASLDAKSSPEDVLAAIRAQGL